LPFLHHSLLLLLAMFLGGMVGLDRERTEHPAGLRTHILVCVGAALITIVGASFKNADGKIAAQIVSGVGFLGAGTILREANGSVVRGLTTAASLWAVAGIGIAVGYDGLSAELAVSATIIVCVTLSAITRLERVLNKTRMHQEIKFILATKEDALLKITQALDCLHDLGIKTSDFRVEEIVDGLVVHVQLWLPNLATRDLVKPALTNMAGIIRAQWAQY
jgi:putative Mg2+ transporter-C (MgtC) family protein